MNHDHIKDLIKLAQQDKPDFIQIIASAYNRGFIDGKDHSRYGEERYQDGLRDAKSNREVEIKHSGLYASECPKCNPSLISNS